MKIAFAQINSHLGNFKLNKEKILSFTFKAKQASCDLIVFPELALFGYTHSDFMEYDEFVRKELFEIKDLEKKIPKNIYVLFGALTKNKRKKGKPFHNSAILLKSGSPLKVFNKNLLPAYDVFDENRHIESGRKAFHTFKIKKTHIFLTICEDIWAWEKKGTSIYSSNPLKDNFSSLKTKKPHFLINISASPWSPNKQSLRDFMAKKTARHFNAPVLFVNRVGAQDELIFDGRSFVINQSGIRVAQANQFREDLSFIDLQTLKGSFFPWIKNKNEEILEALAVGIKDFVSKSGFKKAHLGLSGGIDSALVAYLAVRALGERNVTCIHLPGPYSQRKSTVLAKNLSQRLKTRWLECSINEAYDLLEAKCKNAFGRFPFGVINENLQARIRNLFLMAYANKESSLLLNSTNKSELFMGYGTLYGDLSGALCVIGDLLKTQVFELSKFLNKEKRKQKNSLLIPLEIINRAPSAELKPKQTDFKELKISYKELDRKIIQVILKKQYLKGKKNEKLMNRLMRTEFKRWQSPPILKVSKHAFGRGRRFSITHEFYPW